MDIIYGLKTDPDGALKGRLGNLQGITHPSFGQLKGFGELLQNLYAVGDLVLRRTGENIDTKFQVLSDLFSSNFTKTEYELTDDTNYLHNGQFLTSSADESIIDGWTIDDTDDTAFWVDPTTGMPVMVNGNATTSGNRRVEIERIEGKQVLRLVNCGITQKNALIDQPKTHKEYSNPSGKQNTKTDSAGNNAVTLNTATDGSVKEVQDTLYVSLRIYALTSGKLTVGFNGSTDVQGKDNTLKVRDITVPYSGEWTSVEFNGKWNGTGDFVIRYTGDCRVAFVAITDTALANLAKTVSTSIEQTNEAIKLLGQNDDRIARQYTGLGFILDATNKKLEAFVSTAQTKEEAANQVRQLSELIDAVDTKAGNNASLIQQQADRIGILSGHFDDNGHLTELSGYITTAQYNELVSTVGGNKEENQRQINALKDVINGVDGKVGNNASLIQQQADRIGILAGHFDDKGHLTELSGYATTAQVNEMFSSKFNDNGELKDKTGIVTTTDFQGWKNGDYTRDKQDLKGLIDNKLDTTAFASMYASSVAQDKSIVKTASMSVYVQKDGDNYISNAKIKADKIELEGLTTVNSNFKVLEDGSIEAVNGKFTGEINATSGKIGGFNINGSYIGIKNGFTDTSVDGMWLTNTELGFNGTDGRQTIIGTWFATGMGNLLGRFLDTGNDISAKCGIVIDVSNSMMDNIAMEFGGGCVAGLALKTATYGLEQITKSTFTGTYNGKTMNLDQIPIFDTLPRLTNAVVVSTMFYYRNAEKENGKDKEYSKYTRDRYITLPDVTDADDGHVVMIKRGQGSDGTVYIRAGNYKQLLYNISTHAYYTETSKCYLLVDAQSTIAGIYDSNKRTIVDGEYQLKSESDASTFVFFRNYSVTIPGNSGTLKKTYKGCWVQWKNPRDW